jgi:hypothetical protein
MACEKNLLEELKIAQENENVVINKIGIEVQKTNLKYVNFKKLKEELKTSHKALMEIIDKLIIT